MNYLQTTETSSNFCKTVNKNIEFSEVLPFFYKTEKKEYDEFVVTNNTKQFIPSKTTENMSCSTLCTEKLLMSSYTFRPEEPLNINKFGKCETKTNDENIETEYKENIPQMSEEQETIYKCIKNGDNAIGDACAGSGKSTTILSIAKNMKEKQFVQLTYNSMLCNDIKEKIEKYRLTNLNVYTYHSLVVKYYDSTGYTDTVIRKVVLHNTNPKINIRKFDILVLDETQDMTLLYFKLVLKFCRDMGKKIQLLILGDYMQGLYEFKGADIRFLTKSQDIWSSYEGLLSKTFHNCYLKMSYRITNQMASFVNNVMLGEQRLLACKEGEPVVYIRQPTHFAEKYIIYKINLLISEFEASPSDFFILGASIKGNNSEIRKIENALVESNIPCYVPLTEDDKIDERVIEGKVVFSTFHSVKGRQRKYVFVIGFNHSYFNFYAKRLSTNICPNTLYVACTRATEGLYIVEHNNRRYDRPPKFLKMNHIDLKTKPYIVFKGMHQTIFEEATDSSINDSNLLVVKKTTPTELVRFLPEQVFDKINNILEKIFIPLHLYSLDTVKFSEQNVEKNSIGFVNESTKTEIFETKCKKIDIPNIIKTKKGFYEDVSNINGIALPIMYFDSFLSNLSKSPERSVLEEQNIVACEGKLEDLQTFVEREEMDIFSEQSVEKITNITEAYPILNIKFSEKISNKPNKNKQKIIYVLQDLIKEQIENTKQNHHSYLRKEFELLQNDFEENNCKNNIGSQEWGFDFLPLQDTVNWSSPTLRSGEFLNTKISKYLRTSNLYYSVKEKLYFKMKQIQNDEYNWLSKEIIEQCFQQMNQVLYNEICDKDNEYIFKGKVEYTFLDANDDLKHSKIDIFLKEYFPNFIFRFNARADLVTDDSVWEIKCVNSITHEHLIQLLIYCWLWRMTMEDIENFENIVNFQIFNIKTGEHYLLNATMEELNEVMLIILRGKYTDLLYETDEIFIENCKRCFINK
jgi:hypothetical protein